MIKGWRNRQCFKCFHPNIVENPKPGKAYFIDCIWCKGIITVGHKAVEDDEEAV